jgi:HD-GYP domain-containing protein (c-di-GMP phosphodiesterase class II)
MKRYAVNAIPADSFFPKPVYLEGEFLLTTPEMPFTGEMAQALADWGFDEVVSESAPGEVSEPEDAVLDVEANDDGKMREAEEFYLSLRQYAETLFAQVTFNRTLVFRTVVERMKNVCAFVQDNSRFLLRIQQDTAPKNSPNYLASHSARSTIIAIIIGRYLKLPAHRLIELGVAALLHEIGMTKLPREVYLRDRPLGPQEQEILYTHPEQGYQLLNSFNFPVVVSSAALEHHERENGSGYPRHLSGNKISLYSKIIAVACSYETLSSRRPHREAKDGYMTMLELLKNEGKQYDDTVVRALVYSLSIYPIGIHVLLSNGKKGQVIDVNTENPRYPVVRVFDETAPDGKPMAVKTSPGGLAIVRPLAEDETGG